MFNTRSTHKVWFTIVAATVFVPSLVFSQPAPRQAVTNETETDLSPQDSRILSYARECASRISKVMDNWIKEGQIKKERLFAYLYYPIANTDPQKFSTDYDKLADSDFPRIQEQCMSREPEIRFAIAVDRNGYVPTHNTAYSKPLTGKLAIDLKGSRTKRMFNDRTGFAAARNEEPYLVQVYKRDTGETMKDLSVPLTIDGEKWGSFRIGYSPK